MNNLPEIHDIYIPEGVSAFPLAYGWWIIIACIFLGAFFLKFILWSVKTSKKHYALNKLKKIDTSLPIESAIKMSELLRRICNIKFKEARALYGEEWIDFLNEHSSHKLSESAAKLLAFAPFMDKNSKKYDVKTAVQLKEFCQHWIGANL